MGFFGFIAPGQGIHRELWKGRAAHSLWRSRRGGPGGPGSRDHGVPSHDPPSNGCGFGTGDPMADCFESSNLRLRGFLGLPWASQHRNPHGSLREVGHDVAEVCCEAEPFLRCFFSARSGANSRKFDHSMSDWILYTVVGYSATDLVTIVYIIVW